ncbi:MAG: hypothetical protein Q9P14_19265 [candidate division KSB1 bacterium]|nr:hypothetical protein [candidate division KSB1 bacterium]MDQ7063148.1 hypothetical protein [candidate division KSB1 bacterium]
MEMQYDVLIENIKNLSLSDKEELKKLIEKYFIEEKRKEIAKNYSKSIAELRKGKLSFSSNIDELRKSIETE